MKTKILKAIGVIMMASIAVAAPTCLSSLGVDVTTLNAGGGCTVGTFTFNNFAVQLAGGSGSPVVNLSGVNNPGVGGTGLNFNPNLGSGHTESDIHFLYSLTTSSGLINSAYLGNGGIGGGGIGERICDSAGVSLSGLCVGAQITTLSALNGAVDAQSFAGQTTIWIWKDITINNIATDHNSSVDQNFSGVPEPATYSMMGIGLVGLGLIARRRKK